MVVGTVVGSVTVGSAEVVVDSGTVVVGASVTVGSGVGGPSSAAAGTARRAVENRASTRLAARGRRGAMVICGSFGPLPGRLKGCHPSTPSAGAGTAARRAGPAAGSPTLGRHARRPLLRSQS